MKKSLSANNNLLSLRYAVLAPLTLMIAAAVSCCHSYSTARQDITDDLNDAVFALANENSEFWTRQDTITALRKMHEATHKPIIYQASDLCFRNAALRDEAYFTLALVDRKNAAPKIQGHKIASDSITLVPESAVGDGLAIQVQCFADCSMASLFAASDQTLPGVLFTLSILSMASLFIWRKKETEPVPDLSSVHPFDGIRLTPMQRQFAQMLLDAPGRRVDKATICSTLWGNKSNAEE